MSSRGYRGDCETETSRNRRADDVTDLSADIADAPTAELVTCARAGSRPAWEELVDRFTPLLWSIALRHRLDHADAADAVQTTWLRLVEHLYRIREPSRVPGWLLLGQLPLGQPWPPVGTQHPD